METPRWLTDIDTIIADANARVPAAYIKAAPIQRDYLVHMLSTIADRARADVATAHYHSEAAAQLNALIDQLNGEYEVLLDRHQSVLADADALRSKVAGLEQGADLLLADVDHFKAEVQQLEIDVVTLGNELQAAEVRQSDELVAARTELTLRKAVDTLEQHADALRDGLNTHDELRQRFNEAVQQVGGPNNVGPFDLTFQAFDGSDNG